MAVFSSTQNTAAWQGTWRYRRMMSAASVLKSRSVAASATARASQDPAQRTWGGGHDSARPAGRFLTPYRIYLD